MPYMVVNSRGYTFIGGPPFYVKCRIGGFSMKEQLIELMNVYPAAAMLISITLNIAISVFGVVPSVFLTAGNLTVFGFWKGTLISFIGEALGAAVAFLLYRKGFKRFVEQKLKDSPRANRLLRARGVEAFWLILSLRLLPFVPSGVVTFAAAMSQTSLWVFVVASTIGKAPSLIMEAYSIYEISQWTGTGKVILVLFSFLILVIIGKKYHNRRRDD